MTQQKKDQQTLRSELTDEQYRVTQERGTEPAFTGKYWDMKTDGTYSCICCGTELFRSDEKFDSGTGWPSFWLPLAGDFPDGPKPSGLRYCINSASLDFEAGE
jgi:peptide-methionine (R)-S-oxide reductase